MKKKLYLFDMDGTLLDSMHVWSDIDKRFLSKHNITAPDDFSEKIAAMTLPECADYFIELGVQKSKDEIISGFIKDVEEEYRLHIPLIPGMDDVLKKLHSEGHTICLITSSERSYIIPALKRLNIYDYFTEVYTSTELGMNKRSGDIYKKLCDMHGFSPEDTVVYEDALFAINSAKSAGCHVVAVYGSDSRDNFEDIADIADEIYRY